MKQPKAATPHQTLQLQAMRDALERAGDAATKSRETAARANAEVSNMRQNNTRLQLELHRIAKESDHVLEENKRLRHAIAEMYRERELLREKLREATTGRLPAPPADGTILPLIAPSPNPTAEEESLEEPSFQS